MSELDFYKGHWSAIPHALATLTSGNAFLLLFNIIRNAPKSICNEPIVLSKNRLALAMGVSYHTVNNSIKELEQLNLISATPSNGSTTSFRINWEEIQMIHNISSCTTDEGWSALRKLLHDNAHSFSELQQQHLDFIKQQYKRTYAENAYAVSAYAKSAEVDNEPMQKLHSFTERIPRTYAEIAEVADKAMQKLHSLLETYAENAEVIKLLRNKAIQYGLLKNTTYAENAELCEKSYAEIAEVAPKSYAISAYSIDIYKDKEKDDGELRSPIKGREKKEKVLKWFESRDLSFPVLSSNDFDSIINLPDFADEDFDKAVRQVWGYLQYDNSPDGFKNNFIPAEFFMDFLFRAWNDLKELDENFSLSEQDMKNIFGFDISERDGELVCYVTPSKIHDITAPVEIVSRPTRKRDANDRIQRMLFVEAVTDIAKQDEKFLSDSEYIVWQIIKTVEENKANGIPRADEITKLQFNDFIQIWSEETSIPVKDIQSLLKDLPQKGKVTLSALQLLPDNFFQYNHEHDDTNNVEELFNKKLEEYKNDDDNVE